MNKIITKTELREIVNDYKNKYDKMLMLKA